VRTFGFAFIAAIVGVALSLGMIYGAATTWSTFSDGWMTAAGVLPVVAILGAAWGVRKMAGQPWPIPEKGTRLGLALMAASFSALSCYVAFAIVSVIWNHVDLAAQGGFLALLLDPEKIPALSQRGSSGNAMALTAISQGAIGAFAGGLVAFLGTGRKY
jgi:hypothetical protein